MGPPLGLPLERGEFWTVDFWRCLHYGFFFGVVYFVGDISSWRRSRLGCFFPRVKSGRSPSFRSLGHGGLWRLLRPALPWFQGTLAHNRTGFFFPRLPCPPCRREYLVPANAISIVLSLLGGVSVTTWTPSQVGSLLQVFPGSPPFSIGSAPPFLASGFSSVSLLQSCQPK